MSPVLRLGERVYDRLDSVWARVREGRTLGTVLVLSYLVALVVIELNRQGLLPAPAARLIPTNHFAAVGLAFTLVLFYEVLGLVFVLSESVSKSVGKQFELVSLILLRKAFLKFAEFGEPIEWTQVEGVVLELLSDAVGGVLVFVVLGFYYQAQQHAPITESEREEAAFVASKKIVSLLLIASFACVGAYDAYLYLTGTPFPFFEAFYVLLIFSDILIVLISFRYSYNYRVLLRNTGFAISTVMIRLALTAPPHVAPALALGAVTFALGLTLAYNHFAPLMEARVPQRGEAALQGTGADGDPGGGDGA